MKLQEAWYTQRRASPLWIWFLAPLTALFFLISRIRAKLYRYKILSVYQSKLPVIVVGNISVGGNGKTPVVLALVSYLKHHGIACAVLSRGYGGKQTQFPHLLLADSTPEMVGDEPALISQRMNIPVVIDPKRARGAKFIEDTTNAQVIICDDGLQHYALDRDIELCVMDKRGVGNGYLMPMGPLRESSSRLNTVDWLIYNGEDTSAHSCLQEVSARVALMSLSPMAWINVKSGAKLNLNDALLHFNESKSLAAIAGIGDPKRFFTTLMDLKINVTSERGLPDHHAITLADIPSADIVLMTEKDAIKCKPFASENCWYLQIEALLPNALYDNVQQTLAHKLA